MYPTEVGVDVRVWNFPLMPNKKIMTEKQRFNYIASTVLPSVSSMGAVPAHRKVGQPGDRMTCHATYLSLEGAACEFQFFT